MRSHANAHATDHSDRGGRRSDGSGRRSGYGGRTAATRRTVLRRAAGAVGLAAGSGLAATAGAQSDADVPVVDLTDEAPAMEGDLPTDADELVLFLHGWLGTSAVEDQATTLRTSLRQEGYEHPVVAVRWDATNPVFTEAQSDADVAGERLAEWLAGFREEYPALGVRAVAHSLGGRVALSALATATEASLPSDGGPLLETVAPVGAAVVSDAVCPDGRYHEPVRSAAGAVHNFHSENDDTVCTSFGVAGGGLGCTGAACEDAPENYEDVDVTDRVPDHGSYVDPEDGCVDAIVERFDGGGSEEPCRDPAVVDLDGFDPQDVDGDGLYRDANGDGSVRSDDVVTFFEHHHRSVVQERPGCFDYSGNGAVNARDVVELFEYATLR